MFYLFWKVGDTLKGFLLCLITYYRLIFLWKAQMAAIIAPPPYLFQYGKSLLKSKNTKSTKSTTYDMLWNCTLDKNYRQIQNEGHNRPKWWPPFWILVAILDLISIIINLKHFWCLIQPLYIFSLVYCKKLFYVNV